MKTVIDGNTKYEFEKNRNLSIKIPEIINGIAKPNE